MIDSLLETSFLGPILDLKNSSQSETSRNRPSESDLQVKEIVMTKITSETAPATSEQVQHIVEMFQAQVPLMVEKYLGSYEAGVEFISRGTEAMDATRDAVRDIVRRFSVKVPDYTQAQVILGVDFITPEEVAKARGLVYTDDQLAELAETVPSLDVLEWCKANGYAVMPASPSAMSLLEVRAVKSNHFYSKSGGWYENENFAREDKTSFGWLAIRKTPVKNSTSKTWGEQNKLLSKLETVPNAAEMSWFITTYYEVRGIRLFENIYVRTSSLDSHGYHVRVGLFDAKGLGVYCWYGDRRYGLGLASSRKK